MGAKSGKKRVVEVEGQEYQPTKVELEADLSLPDGVTPEEVVRALFSGDPPVVESGRGEESRREWQAWKARRANGG